MEHYEKYAKLTKEHDWWGICELNGIDKKRLHLQKNHLKYYLNNWKKMKLYLQLQVEYLKN